MGEEIVRAVLEDHTRAPVSEKLRAMLHFLKKMTLEPQDLRTADVEPLRASGLTNEAIEDAIHVAAIFNLIDRMADALEFEVPPSEFFAKMAPMMLKRGYR